MPRLQLRGLFSGIDDLCHAVGLLVDGLGAVAGEEFWSSFQIAITAE